MHKDAEKCTRCGAIAVKSLNLLLCLVSGRPKASAKLARPRRRWLAAMSAATRDAEQPGKKVQVAEQRLNFKRSQHLHSFTKKQLQSICSCSLMFAFKVHCFRFLEFPSSWMACVQEERGAAPRQTRFSEWQDENYSTNVQKLWKHTHERPWKVLSFLQYLAPSFPRGCRYCQGHFCFCSTFYLRPSSSSSERLFFASLGLDALTSSTSRVLHKFFHVFSITQEMVWDVLHKSTKSTDHGTNSRPAQAQYMR